jgi:hypothetical protein
MSTIDPHRARYNIMQTESCMDWARIVSSSVRDVVHQIEPTHMLHVRRPIRRRIYIYTSLSSH